ncbi:MAG TPA: hypothetical protein VFV02_01050 [Acidimicrobiales bacterium]|nr:hypothetical protein [Acidimicrobiales bacterium]
MGIPSVDSLCLPAVPLRRHVESFNNTVETPTTQVSDRTISTPLAFAPPIPSLPDALEATWNHDAEIPVRLYARYALRMLEAPHANT